MPWQPALPHENMPTQHAFANENTRTPQRLDTLVAQHAARRPDQRLAVDLNKTLSAAQLWTRACELALAMRQHHPAPNTIALAMERSTDWLACLLAIWQNGATAVIIDTQWPAERADTVIQDSGAALLWTDTGGVNIPDCADVAPTEASPFQDTSTTHPNPVAAIVYTSGSSGRPKGIPIRHDALVRLGHSLARHYALTPDSSILQVVAPAFDVTLSDIAMSWCTGATLVTLPRHSVMPGTTLNETLDAWGITHMQVPPLF
ncbi:AMP-binding protein [Neopusillimonas aromaticivorans]|nr:AMP-binding protein [Neopusillimonas aromaticivorans]WJJ92659.1 AMP-binding protein [Neopusillimonas aromaticivorans]